MYNIEEIVYNIVNGQKTKYFNQKSNEISNLNQKYLYMGKAAGYQNIQVFIKTHEEPITCKDIGAMADVAAKVDVEGAIPATMWLKGMKDVYHQVFEYLMVSPVHKYKMYFYDLFGNTTKEVYYDDLDEVNKAYVGVFTSGKNLYNLPTVWEYSKGEYVRKPGY